MALAAEELFETEVEEVRDWESLVSDDIVESRHIPEGRLRNFDPGDVWLIEVTLYKSTPDALFGMGLQGCQGSDHRWP
jgi:hypothetical protein